jgi:formylglycine-generating enzyme required for sulfatase activity
MNFRFPRGSAAWPAFFFLCVLTAALAASLENGPAPKMIAVAGGTFFMGSNEGAFSRNERVHEVTLKPFLISEAEVTQDLYQAVMKENPSRFKNGENPVESISWFDAVRFCNALSEQCGFAPAYVIEGETVVWNRESRGFRLPTEAEWEYAARGGQYGTTEPLTRALYSGGETAPELAWYSANSARRPQPVKRKLPNELGLYDMSGNVWEWCWDWFNDYPSGPAVDPCGAAAGRNRVYRGGSFFNQLQQIRITFRMSEPPVLKAYSVGFRIAQNR